MRMSQSSYAAYLLRLWRDEPEGPWRASVERPSGGQPRHFASLQQFSDWLWEQYPEQSKEHRMSENVTLILEGFPKLEVREYSVRVESTSATKASRLQEILQNGYQKWQASKERESVLNVSAVDLREAGLNMLFDSSRQSAQAIEALSKAGIVSIKIKAGRAGDTWVINHEEQ